MATHKNYTALDIAAEHFRKVVDCYHKIDTVVPFDTAVDKVVDTAADNSNNCSGNHKNFRP